MKNEDKKNEEEKTEPEQTKSEDEGGLLWLVQDSNSPAGRKFRNTLYKFGGFILLGLAVMLGLKVALMIIALVLTVAGIATGRSAG